MCSFQACLFSFDPIGKGFFARVIVDKVGQQYDENVHAYMKFRRRESAAIVSLVVPFKLNTQLLQCLNTFNDKTHVFCCYQK